MRVHIDCQVTGVADTDCYDRLPRGAVQLGAGDRRNLAIVDEVQVSLHWVDSDGAWGFFGRFLENQSVFAIQPGYFHVSLMLEHIGEVHIVGHPVDCQTTNAIGADTLQI